MLSSTDTVKVLIAEDSKSIAAMLRDMCVAAGCNPDVAENGRVAMDMMKQAKYDIFVVDLVMPEVDGLELIKYIKQKEKDPLILVETATEKPETIIEVMRQGVFDYIIKPIDLDSIESVLKRAKQYHHSLRTHQQFEQSIKHEISVIRNIQSSMMPDFNDISSFEIAISMVPAIDLSGDFYDVFEITDTVYNLVLCDVAGHGLASAYMGAQFKGILRYISRQNQELDSTLFAMNKYIVSTFNTTSQYNTAVMCQVDNHKGTMKYISAGHPPGYLWKAATNSFEKLSSTGPILGAFPSATYTSKTIAMEEGDTILFFTDGVTDMMNITTRERFGSERLEEVIHQLAGKSPHDIILEVLARCYEFTDHVGQVDDMTVLAIRKR